MQHSKAAVDLLRTAQDALARSGGLLHRTGLVGDAWGCRRLARC